MTVSLFHKPYRILIAAMALICVSMPDSLAQESDNFIFDHLTIDDGLSQSTVFAITKDANGYLWFGTRDGLSRYDSRSMKVYRNRKSDSKSLSANGIQCLFIDAYKTLWIGTSEGISIYHPEQDNFTQSKPNPDINQRLSGNHVSAIAEDKHGTVWVSTHGGLYKVLSRNPLRYQHFKHDDADANSLLHNEVRTLFLDKKGELWLGTAVGVSRLSRNQEGQYSFVNYRLPSHALKGKSWINCLAEDSEGNILIGTEENGIKLLDRKSGVITPYKNLDGLAGRSIESVRVIKQTGSHEYWVGTIDGLYIYNAAQKKITTLRNNPDDQTTLSDNSVRSVYVDPSGTYWVGTFYGGVNSYSPLSRQFGEVVLTNKKNQKAYKVAGAIVTDKQHNLWISTDGNGLYCLNEKGEIISQFKHNPNDPATLSHNKIKCLMLDDHGLWIGTINGLDYYDFLSRKFRHFFNEPANVNSIPDDRIYDIKKDDDGYIWIATYRGGLCRFDKKTNTFERFTSKPGVPTSLSSDGVTYIHKDAENNLWIGTVSGLNKKPHGQTAFERYRSAAGEDYVMCIYEDKRKNLWVGMRDTGLKLKKPGSKVLTGFTMEQGLPGNNVSGIQEDEHGYLWISTDNGLSRLDPATMVFKNYNKDDGLACKEFNLNSFHKDDKGFLYFGGYNGIVKFHPDSIRENTIPPTLQFTKLKIFNKEVAIDSTGDGVLSQSLSHTASLSFTYQQNVFSVEFAALSFINASKNRYAYTLDGFEDQWNYVEDPIATYMNLRPGDYTLLVKASNNDGVWTKDPIRMHINVLPPPWKTWWAYTVYCTIILGLLYALIRFNKMRWKLAHDLQLEHLEKDQQEKLHHAKLNFFTNIAHEIRTPLTLIVSPVELMEEQYTQDPFLQRQLRIVKSNTTRLMRLINQLLDFQKQEAGNFNLKMQDGNIVDLLKEIVFSFTEHANSRRIQLTFAADYHTVFLPFDHDELEKVFCNLLHNAFKFTPGGGEISVSVTIEHIQEGDVTKPYTKILVEDNGIGIPSEDLPKIFNRFFQVENTSINESGFGIGLALAKGIVNLHGGTIHVDSMEGVTGQSGFTRFTVLLPLPMETSTPATLPAEPSTVEHQLLEAAFDEEEHTDAAVTRKRSDKPLILLIEDNVEIRTCLKTILCSSSQILEASNGKEGWEIATQHLPDLVISDIAMPEMDGLEFTRLMKKDERTNHIPVILLTARGAMEHHIEGIETGADDYITKPFHARILQLKVRNLLTSREKLKEKYHRVVTFEPMEEALEDPDNKFLTRLKNVLEPNLNDPDFNVTKLVTEIGMSRPVLFRKIKMLTGLSVIDLIRSMRLKKAEMLLKQRKMSVSEVAFTVGFNDPKYFSKSFRSQFGKTPTEYMESMEG
jgi:ligand-binding sensor domain-containing protein/CheY-like chemotaxis protein/nitrogen-specific signal transduction histidine kinase/AraC-like DNA-binding protein